MNFIGFHSKTISTRLFKSVFPDQRSFFWIALSILLAAFSGVLAGCSASGATDEHSYPMAPMHEMPADVQNAPVTVQQAYQFAVANPEVLQQLPCYCGCGAVGHKSNYACYLSGVDESGAVTFDAHALGCSICVDITQDAMRLLDQGKSVPEIRAYVDDTYAKFGPSNMP
ncbi:MAG: hypothetical protein A2Z45_04165 [Chloroflexi bacterium RBG_19FT_COMBO_55_16]|nr:MAG: hypothetical protein A2Z45_04165 [Chloroflexi bacterium RBG_19FT_COMBO_55_16]